MAILNRKSKNSPPPLQETMQPVKLPRPAVSRDKPVFRAIQNRKTIREISQRKLSIQMLSNILWAAYGVNRKKGPFNIPGRTAASASNSQEIDIYVIVSEGIYLYDAIRHTLLPVAEGDHRRLAVNPGQADMTAETPLNLLYVADIERLRSTSGFREPGLLDSEIQKSYYFADTGLIAGNVYIFAASQGLSSWFHNCNKQALSDILKLRPDQRILFGQTVGYAVGRKRDK